MKEFKGTWCEQEKIFLHNVRHSVSFNISGELEDSGVWNWERRTMLFSFPILQFYIIFENERYKAQEEMVFSHVKRHESQSSDQLDCCCRFLWMHTGIIKCNLKLGVGLLRANEVTWPATANEFHTLSYPQVTYKKPVRTRLWWWVTSLNSGSATLMKGAVIAFMKWIHNFQPPERLIKWKSWY